MIDYLKDVYDYESGLSPIIKKESGITYTPYFIVDYINTRLLDKLNHQIDSDFKAIDVSCGGGVFLIDLIYKIKKITNESFKKIIEDRIYGIDSDQRAIGLLRGLFIKMAVSEDSVLDRINLFCGNSLNKEFLYNNLNDIKFRAIPGNPPYVRIQNISDIERSYLKDWSLIVGNTDLYIPFYEIATEIMDDKGVAGYISSNTFLKNKSGVVLSEYLLNKKMIYEIVDFKDRQIFSGLNTYTCICLFGRNSNKYYEYKEPDANFNIGQMMHFRSCKKIYPVPQNEIAILNEDVEIIKKIENAGDKLAKIVKIKVGLATLSDDIYFLKGGVDYGNCLYFSKNEITIEKDILKPCIKVSTIKNIEDVVSSNDYIIFPYKKQNDKYIPMTEDNLREFPFVYSYLLSHKDRLLSRDKNKINPDKWYLYGRTQGLNSLWGEKLLIPPLVKSPLFIESFNENLLYLSGYAIFNDSSYELSVLKRILESSVMKLYMDKKSKKMQDGWVVYSKEFMKNFSIPRLNKEEIEFIKTANNELLNSFLMKKYGLTK